MRLRSVAFLFAALLGQEAIALDQTACNAAAKDIDDRIAAGNHAPQNVAIATQLRDGIMQSCAFMDEATLAQMMQGLDQLLPSGDGGSATMPRKSESERKAERAAQRAEADRRQAERERRRAAEQEREAAKQELVSSVVRKPPTGRSVTGQLVSRPDRMWGASIIDWDVYQGRGRLLYETWPSREQQRDADIARHFYVVELDRSNNVAQHHIGEMTLAKTITAGLIPGRDEVVMQWHEGGNKAKESILERWSISQGQMLSQSPAPRMQGPRGALGADRHFRLVTRSGDLLYAESVAMSSGPSARSAVSWLLASLDGEVREQGFINHDNEKVTASDWFHSADGGAGLILDILAVDERGIESQLRPAPVQIGNVEARPIISFERRLYVVGGADTGPELPTIERRHIWLGLENVDPSMNISGESTRLIDEAVSRDRLNDSAVTIAVAGRNRMAVGPISGGHATLVKNNQRDNAFPPTGGLWLQEFVPGQPRRDTYVNPDSEHIDASIEMLASDGAEGLYLGGGRHVLLLDGAREVAAYAKSSVTNASIKAMIAEGNSVWLFSEDSGSRESQQRMWVERLEF